MGPADDFRVVASGAYELWAGSVRPRHRLEVQGEGALHLERPLRLATRTACVMPVADMHEYPLVFADQDISLRCPMCDKVTNGT